MFKELGLYLADKLASSIVFRLPRRIFGNSLNSLLGAMHWEIQPQLQHGTFSDLISEIREEVELTMPDSAVVRVYLLALICANKSAEMAEVGVYQGGSARLICEAKGDTPLHLFDTFEGHPEVSDIDKPFYEKGQLKASLEKVQQYLAEYKNVYFHKGLFPVTAEPVENNRFSFVHLDVDLYESTLDGLGFFYPRMDKGGVIISHDYPAQPGVKRAFDDFFQDKPEPVMRISGNQALVVRM